MPSDCQAAAGGQRLPHQRGNCFLLAQVASDDEHAPIGKARLQQARAVRSAMAHDVAARQFARCQFAERGRLIRQRRQVAGDHGARVRHGKKDLGVAVGAVAQFMMDQAGIAAAMPQAGGACEAPPGHRCCLRLPS